jgi:two-component system cell cycle response regulator DivK
LPSNVIFPIVTTAHHDPAVPPTVIYMTVSAQALLPHPRTTVFHANAKRLKVSMGNISDGEGIFTQPTSDYSNARVLLVQSPRDDGLDMYVEFLHYHGLAPMAVTNAHDALGIAPTADVIVTGILLAASGMDGIALIDRLRGDDRTKNTPIIVLTACAWPSDRARATAAGCDVFLPKPCLPDELLREVRRLLASSCGTPVSPPALRKSMPDVQHDYRIQATRGVIDGRHDFRAARRLPEWWSPSTRARCCDGTRAER